MKVQDGMIERMADKLTAAVASILESQRAHRVKEKAAEEVGVSSGGHNVQVMTASAVEGDSTGSALGKPMSSAEALSMRRGPAMVAAAVLLVRSVRHPTSPDCR